MITLRTAVVLYLALKRAHESLVWNTNLAEHFWHPSGRAQSHDDTRRQLRQYNEAVRDHLGGLTAKLANDTMTLGEWTDAMHGSILDGWRINYMAGRGGREMMTFEDWGRIGGHLNFQYKQLDNFAREMAAGELSPAQVEARARQYINANHTAYEAGRRSGKLAAGFAEERRNEILDGVTCADCADYNARGWQPIGTFPPPGIGCQCGANCRGEFEFRGQLLG